MPAKKSKLSRATRTRLSDAAKLSVVGEYEPREGTNSEKAFKLLRRCGTVGAYRKARERNKLEGLGGLLPNLIREGVVRVKG
jgi:hypothetical protein